MSDQKTAALLAAEIAEGSVTDADFRGLLQELGARVQSRVQGIALQGLLSYGRAVMQKADEEWIRGVASLFLAPDSETQPPKTPAAMREEILMWQAARERDLREKVYKMAREEGFRLGLDKGARLAYGAAGVGKPLDEVLAKCKEFKVT